MIAFYPPKQGRMHEACGAGAYFFAFALATGVGGTVIWVHEAWMRERINPSGFARFVSPDQVLTVLAKDQTELLAASEEALRSGAVKLVVLEVTKPLDLTTGRRLQLAARDGKTTALAIIPSNMGSNTAETRWHCQPVFNPQETSRDSTLQHWQLIKNKSGTLGSWYVRWNEKTHRVTVVPSACERAGSAGMRA